MKAILVNKDKSLRWDEVSNPVLTEDEVLIKVEYAALNRADLMQRNGDYPPPPGCPEWMGLEVAGELVKNVFPKIEAGLVKPTIYKTFPIEAAEEAHAVLQRGENVGKVVLTVG